MKFPYGIADFKAIITEGYFYCDRTDKIPLLENAKSQLFIRPKRFGKSLILSMLENYYDVAKTDEFDTLFGHLAIGRNPTEARNSYCILRWDFSCVDTSGSLQDLKKSLYNHLNVRMEGFISYYTWKGYELPPVKVNYDDALYTLQSLLNAVRTTRYPVYLLIDEYDNFANTLMMEQQRAGGRERYDTLVQEEGILRTLFKTMKSAASGSLIDRVFITGTSPVVLSDITSGYNIAEDIYIEQEFNGLCGFTQSEVRYVIEQIVAACGFGATKINEALVLMKAYYNGYIFAQGMDEHMYNPTLCLYFFKHFQKKCMYPREMLDANLATDEAKLEYIASLHGGGNLIIDLSQQGHEAVISRITTRFGVKEVLDDRSQDYLFLTAFLYYFGVLTLAGETEDLKIRLKVPNLVTQSLYVERVRRMLLPEPGTRDAGGVAAEKVYQKGEIGLLCDFVEQNYFTVFKNRDYRWANELTLKTAFLTLLYNDIIFIIDSEFEVSRRSADLVMIIRPDKRHGKVFDILIEFKFVSLKDAGLSGVQAKALSEEELLCLPGIKKAMNEGEQQVVEYGKKLEEKYGNLRLQKFVVASLGFERVCWNKVITH